MNTEEVGPLINEQTAMIRRRGRGRPANSGTSSSRQQQSQAGMIQFINIMHPDDTANANSLRLIRSHAAKHSRALQREKKQRQSAKPVSLSGGQAIRGLIGHDDEREKEYTDSQEDNETGSRSMPQIRFGVKTRYRKLASKRQTSPLLPRTTGRLKSRSPSPMQLIGGARQDAYQGFARSLSEDEQYLFDFYLNYVILYGYKACYHKEEETVFQASMREVWVPFAMAQPSLMAAIFHVACRNYAANTSNSNSKKFSIKKLQYRLTCLGMAKDAIASQRVATDTTIALALIMASESFFEGDMEAFFTHGMGIIKMVTTRGGLDKLGVSGFLTKSVGWSIYSPKNYLVSGPNEASLENHHVVG